MTPPPASRIAAACSSPLRDLNHRGVPDRLLRWLGRQTWLRYGLRYRVLKHWSDPAGLPAHMQRWLGRIDLALAAWNTGDGAVRRSGQALPPFAETQAQEHVVLDLDWSLLQHGRVRRSTRLQLALD